MVGLVTPCASVFALASFDVALSYRSVQDALNTVARTSLLGHLTFSVTFASSNRSKLPYFWSTLAGAWVSRYLRQSYISCDPIALIGFDSSKPFFWSDLVLERNMRSYMADSIRHGIGPCGYSIPLAREETRAVLSVSSSNLIEDDWRYYIEAIHPELYEFTQHIYCWAINEIEQKTTFTA